MQKCTGAIVGLVLLAATLQPASVLAQVVRTPVGTPAWEPTDIHLYVAPIGSAPNFEDVLTSLQAVLPEPNHRFHPDLVIGPGDPHNPPYTQEIANGVTSAGFAEKTVFDLADFSGTNGIYLAMMNVPGFGVIPAAQGSSPDFASGGDALGMQHGQRKTVWTGWRIESRAAISRRRGARGCGQSVDGRRYV